MIHLEVVTPERLVFEAEVDRVDVPGLDGYLGILPGHAELISQLKPAGLLSYYIGDERGDIAIAEGYVEVNPDRVVVLANQASRPEDIDLSQALSTRDRAERNLQRALADPDADWLLAMIELERASIQVQVAQKR